MCRTNIGHDFQIISGSLFRSKTASYFGLDLYHPKITLRLVVIKRNHHLVLDLTYCFIQTVSASFYHAADSPCCDWNIKYSGKDLMGAFDADGTHGI